MEGRKWEELNMDCLVNVLVRVEKDSLLFDIPLVCKSWYKASLTPLCWRHLDFYEIRSRLAVEYVPHPNLSIDFDFIRTIRNRLFKFVIKRSGGASISLDHPSYGSEQTLVYAAEGCPSLKYLTLHNLCISNNMSIVPSLISNWKNLQKLRLGSDFNVEAILTQVNLHCKNFIDFGILEGNIGEVEARAIVTLLKNIKYLDLRKASLKREYLVMGCKKLVRFDVRDCKGFDVDDEILNLASHIATFLYEGSIVSEDSWSDGELSFFYDDFLIADMYPWDDPLWFY